MKVRKRSGKRRAEQEKNSSGIYLMGPAGGRGASKGGRRMRRTT